MQIILLYRYTRSDGGTTVSTIKPTGEYTEMSRLVAEGGYVLTDGNTVTECVDTENPSAWSEVANNNEASAADYQAALREMGVEV